MTRPTAAHKSVLHYSVTVFGHYGTVQSHHWIPTSGRMCVSVFRAAPGGRRRHVPAGCIHCSSARRHKPLWDPQALRNFKNFQESETARKK